MSENISYDPEQNKSEEDVLRSLVVWDKSLF